MTVLPIVQRELRVAARRRGTYWVRTVMGAAALGAAGWVILTSYPWFSAQEAGQAVLATLSGLVFLYCLLAGLRATADSLSSEKREGTLGLLFLTDLKGYDIVLGKLAATSLNALGGLLAVLPVAAVPLLVGGVTLQQVGRVALVELNTLFFSLAAGMFASALSRDERRAMGLCFAIVAGLTAGVPLVAAAVADRLGLREPPLEWLVPSPGCAMVLAFDPTPSKPQLQAFFSSVAVMHGLAWLFLIGASWVVPHSWQDKPIDAGRSRWRAAWRWLCHGSAEHRLRLRRRLLEINPFYWVAARDRSRAILIWMFLVISGLLWLWAWHTWRQDWLDTPTYIFTGLVLHSVLKWAVASEAAWRLCQDRHSGVLELLLVSPLSVGQIVRGQLRALVRQFAGPAALVLAVDALLLLVERGDEEWVLVWLVGMSVLVADLVTLSLLGMWLGLTRRSHTRALLANLALVCVVPWSIFIFVMTSQGLWPGGSLFHATATEVPLVWWGISMAVDAVLTVGAWHRLRTRFRQVAAQAPGPARLAA